MAKVTKIIINVVSSPESDTDENSEIYSKAIIIARAQNAVEEHLEKVLDNKLVHSLVVATEIVKN